MSMSTHEMYLQIEGKEGNLKKQSSDTLHV